MAATRARARTQFGSAEWIAEERAHNENLTTQESAEFSYAVLNDLEWLNEHMAEVFSENSINVVQIFKTPGKLRGKTPRTVRKVNPTESRQPLSELFAANLQVGSSPFTQKMTIANPYDSGYFGSQPTQVFVDKPELSPTEQVEVDRPESIRTSPQISPPRSPTRSPQRSPERLRPAPKLASPPLIDPQFSMEGENIEDIEVESRVTPQLSHHKSPQKSSQKSSQRSPTRPYMLKSPPKLPIQAAEPEPVIEDEQPEDVHMDEVHSPSIGSSPLRPIVRKSSLNFASLPARQPLTTKKSIGNRTSRTSYLEQSRTSYYGRTTGGKSLGNTRQDEMDIDGDNETVTAHDSKITRLHNKTSTQRLQDQISMLGQSQSHARPRSKSITANGLIALQSSQIVQISTQEPAEKEKSPEHSPQKLQQLKERPTPGAFPIDEDEDIWIGPPPHTLTKPSIFSPRPPLPKSHTADVMEGVHDRDHISGSMFSIPKRREEQRAREPAREPVILTSTFGHLKSASTSVLWSPKSADESSVLLKAISVSNPNPLVGIDDHKTPPKSPTRSIRGSPVKVAKDKFSSILKASKGLFASSAATSALAKTSTLSPPSTRTENCEAPSFEDVLSQTADKASLYPILPNEFISQASFYQAPNSPPKPTRKTRASTEKEERRKEEEAREAKEAKEVQKMEEQLEKARLKVKQDAHIHRLKQERVAAMQKDIAARKEHEKLAKESQVDIPKSTRVSPRRAQTQLEAGSIVIAAANTADASMVMQPPAIPRPKSQIGRPGPKRPVRPAKEPFAKTKPPTVIKVDTGSQRGQQYHPSNATLAATLQESLSAAPSGPPTLKKKASNSSIQSKMSTTSFKASSATKALEAAARKKEQDELAAQRKREAKLENERQRAALREEERRKEEQQRRHEAERQREIQRERAAEIADTKKNAARQAAEKRRQEIERAKQMGAPPAAARHLQDKALPAVPANYRQPEEIQRSINPTPNGAKSKAKRPLQESIDDYPRPAVQRSGPYHNERQSKRQKSSQDFDDEEDMTEERPRMKAPPIRQSSSRQKPIFNGTAAKCQVPFASISTQAKAQQFKTPMRPGGKTVLKSATKSSPQYQNGETIDLPEINTDSDDDDDDDDDDKKTGFTNNASWINSPALREALANQENRDPTEIFGHPRPVDMEQVFSKSKDKFARFRDRTSSANWGGIDRLTEDEIQKDLAAREKIRRQGGWTMG